MSARLRLASFALVLLLALVGLDATTAQPLATGERVRLTPRAGAPVVGVLAAVEGDTLVLASALAAGDTSAVASPPRRTAFARGELARVEVQRGRRGHPWIGLGVGAVVGTAAGYAGGKAQESDCSDEPICIPDALDAPFTCANTVAGLLLGAAVGLGVGLLVRTDRWAAAPVMHAAGPGRNAPGVAVAWRF